MFLTKSVYFIEMRRALETAPDISPWQYLITQFRVIVTYLRLLFIPRNQNFDYDYHIAKSLLELPTLSSFILLVSILTIAIRIFSKYRLISFGFFWFFLTLLPESSIIPIRDVIFEHRLYLPMVGFSFFLVSLVYYIFENKSLKSMIIVLLTIISCYAILTYRRNLIWKDEFTLWNDVVHKSPKKARPYYNRGNAYKDQGSIPQAISDYSRAIEINPNLEVAYYNRGKAYKYKGSIQQAISDYSRAIEINPNFEKAYNNRGVAYYLTKEYDKAWKDVHKAEELGYAVNPEFLNALKKVSGRDK